MLYIGTPLLILGLVMFVRGLIYTRAPDGKMATRRKEKNLRVGFTTDMRVFGRKVRRMGFLLALIGGGLVGTKLTLMRDAAPQNEAAATEK